MLIVEYDRRRLQHKVPPVESPKPARAAVLALTSDRDMAITRVVTLAALIADEKTIERMLSRKERRESFPGTGKDSDAERVALSRGVHPPIRANRAKYGRNKPCACGSGKKFKSCHLAIIKGHVHEHPVPVRA